MEKILTIVIPTYNMEKYLDKCLTSLIIDDKDLMKKLEVLVIIDGATDSSSEIAHTYQHSFPETFITIDKENGNYGSCINRGLKEAKGKYIKVLDADDYFNTADFQSYLYFLQTTDVDMIITDFNIIYENRNEVRTIYRKMRINQDLLVYEMLEDFKNNHLAMHAVTYKTQILKNNHYKQAEGISYTDLEWVLFPIIWSKTVIYKRYNIYQYLLGREGQTMEGITPIKRINHQIKRVVKNIKEYNNSKFDDDKRKKFIENKIIKSCTYIYHCYLIEGRTFLPLSELIEFDNDIKQLNYLIYKELDNSFLNSKVKLKFIKEWRKDVNSRVKIAIILYKIKDLIKRLLYLFSKRYTVS